MSEYKVKLMKILRNVLKLKFFMDFFYNMALVTHVSYGSKTKQTTPITYYSTKETTRALRMISNKKARVIIGFSLSSRSLNMKYLITLALTKIVHLEFVLIRVIIYLIIQDTSVNVVSIRFSSLAIEL